MKVRSSFDGLEETTVFSETCKKKKIEFGGVGNRKINHIGTEMSSNDFIL